MGGLTAMDKWEKEHGDVTPNSGKDYGEYQDPGVNDAEQTNTENWSGDEVRADVQADKAARAGAISQDQKEDINDQLASNNVDAGDESQAVSELTSDLEEATENAGGINDQAGSGGLEGDDTDSGNKNQPVDQTNSTGQPTITVTDIKDQDGSDSSESEPMGNNGQTSVLLLALAAGAVLLWWGS